MLEPERHSATPSDFPDNMSESGSLSGRSLVTDGVDLESRPKSAGCSRDEIMDEDEAERFRAIRGDYEVEFSSNGEVGLHQSKRKCDKNPGHLKFIPVEDFNIEHLPSRYRDNLLVDFVEAQSDLTCRLSVSRISGDRPDTWPDSDQPYPFRALRGKNCGMTGTGWVSGVNKFIEKRNINCECNECLQPGNTPTKTWGEIIITTARHVVYDDEEARHTKCYFFYDSHETGINNVPTLTGGKADDDESDVLKDWRELVADCTHDVEEARHTKCHSFHDSHETDINTVPTLTEDERDLMNGFVTDDCFNVKYITHDVKLVDEFSIMYDRWMDLREKVYNKYLSNNSPDVRVPGVMCDTNVDHDLCIIVSHPHGCSKVVTIGAWTHRDVVEKASDDVVNYSTYRYNTPTCPGSSGAGVFVLYKNIDTEYVIYPLAAHSEGRPGNDNNSGKVWESLKKRQTSVDMQTNTMAAVTKLSTLVP